MRTWRMVPRKRKVCGMVLFAGCSVHIHLQESIKEPNSGRTACLAWRLFSASGSPTGRVSFLRRRHHGLGAHHFSRDVPTLTSRANTTTTSTIGFAQRLCQLSLESDPACKWCFLREGQPRRGRQHQTNDVDTWSPLRVNRRGDPLRPSR